MMSGCPRLSLSPFKELQWPTVFPTRLRYNDAKPLVSAGNQGIYVYRMNSVFDPDFTGLGTQPSGYDQLSALYGRYRVMAIECRLQATSQTSASSGCALVVMAACDNSALSVNAETLGEQRYSRQALCQAGGIGAKLRALWHIGELLGYSDESMLANSNVEAAISANPAFQQYLFIQTETSGATDTVYLEVELTYYVRFEVPITQGASIPKKHLVASAAISNSGAACGGAKSTAPAQLASAQLQKVRQMLDGL